MNNSPFICNNLLSDYVDEVLPMGRTSEIREYLKTHPDCEQEYQDLQVALEVLKSIPARPLSHELAIQITETTVPRRTGKITEVSVSQFVMFLMVPVLIFGALTVSLPSMFPWLDQFRATSQQATFVRYFPLLQGASEIIEEHAAWLQVRGPFMRSFWEEGGLSPGEFERAFSVTLPTTEDLGLDSEEAVDEGG